MVLNMDDIIPPMRQGNIIPFPAGRRARRCTFPVECAQEVQTLPAASAQVHPVVQLRKKLGIKQRVLADLTGLGLTTIKRVEYREKVSLYTVSAICEFFSERFKRSFAMGEIVPISQWQGYDG